MTAVSISYANCSFTLVDLKKETYQKNCIDKKTLSNKQCSDLQFYIKKCGVAVTTFDVHVNPSGEISVNKR